MQMTLTIVFECEKLACGGCEYVQYEDDDDKFWCRIFGGNLVTDRIGIIQRCQDCIDSAKEMAK